MRTREQFIEHWRIKLAGMALYGAVTEATEGPLARAAHALKIPREVEKLLGQMYDDLKPEPQSLPVKPEPKPLVNGPLVKPTGVKA